MKKRNLPILMKETNLIVLNRDAAEMRRKPGLMASKSIEQKARSVHQRLQRTEPFAALTSGEEALKIVYRSSMPSSMSLLM